jgi:hypothetical protein
VVAAGVGFVSRIAARLLTDLADRGTLPAQLSAVFTSQAAAQTAHDPGRVLIDVP